MNCIELFLQQAKSNPDRMALCIPGKQEISFGELLKMAAKAAAAFRVYQIEPGTPVLLLEPLGVQLYASLIALLSLGAKVVLVEPWMPVPKIHQVIRYIRPAIFVSNWQGYLWGGRIKAIREIPDWMRTSSLFLREQTPHLQYEDVPPDTVGIITFTSGTTGQPKGVVRSHEYLIRQHGVLSHHLKVSGLEAPDLCIFANFALSNLASGRGTVLIPSGWDLSLLRKLHELPKTLQPVTLTTGPAFLLQMMKFSHSSSLKSIHVGGAQTDCWIFEKAFEHWPDAHFTHIYGGSEVEPVALIDARKAVQQSRSQNLFQVLYLGKNVPEISASIELDQLWVSGAHVCPEYLGNATENLLLKRTDTQGRIWHCMGDRVQENQSGWWYQGRSSQPREDFKLEQSVYSFLQSSSSFIHRFQKKKWLCGKRILPEKASLLKRFPELDDVIEMPIIRDRRHQARIDRLNTLQRGAPWLVG